MKLTDYPPTRQEARARGLTRYFTAKPCRHGHLDLRFLTGTCVSCQRRAIGLWQSRNPESQRKRAAEYYARYPERVKANSLKSKRKAMGIPEAPRPKPEHCECCGNKETRPGQMHLDHCHITGDFRGWLCGSCNRGIGLLGDCTGGLQRALDYLKLAKSA